jgi:LemA protein
MKKSTILLATVLVIFWSIVIIFFIYRNSYNKAIQLDEIVNKSWGNVSTNYQRRADLIPQLVATVKGAAKNEGDILKSVTQARAGIIEAKTPEQMELMGKKINTAINLAFEAYPQIKSTENFSALQAQLEGTENRINKARQDYNEAVSEYNIHVRGFFNSIFLNPVTFPKKTPFAAVAGSEVAPTVDFSK